MEELARQMRSYVDACNVPDRELDSVLWFRLCDGHGPWNVEVLVWLPCASAQRSRLLPEVFDDCCWSQAHSAVSGQSSGIWTRPFLALNFLETGRVAPAESCEKVGTPVTATVVGKCVGRASTPPSRMCVLLFVMFSEFFYHFVALRTSLLTMVSCCAYK